MLADCSQVVKLLKGKLEGVQVWRIKVIEVQNVINTQVFKSQDGGGQVDASYLRDSHIWHLFFIEFL
jgi:signal transduction histidine kinase